LTKKAKEKQQWKIRYLLVEVIVMTIIAVTAWSKIAMYCKGKVVKHRESIISSTEIQENSLSRLLKRGSNGGTQQKKSIPVLFCKTQH
jgi:hypothetical protein